MKSAISFIITAIFYCQALAQNSNPGLDSTFGKGGIVKDVYTNDKFKTPTDVVLQPDGKIIVTGEFIGRYKHDGTPDSSFGGVGLIRTSNFTTPNDAYATSVVLQNDKKIIVTTYSPTGSSVLRILPDGTPDSSFGAFGVARLCCGNAVCCVLQTDGKIVIGSEGIYSAIAARLNLNGSIDSTFGGKGFVETRTGIYQGHVEGIGVLPDGRVVIGGTGYDSNRQYSQLALRFLPDGQPDSSLGGTGIVFPLHAFYCRDFVVQPDGKMLLAIRWLKRW